MRVWRDCLGAKFQSNMADEKGFSWAADGQDVNATSMVATFFLQLFFQLFFLCLMCFLCLGKLAKTLIMVYSPIEHSLDIFLLVFFKVSLYCMTRVFSINLGQF